MKNQYNNIPIYFKDKYYYNDGKVYSTKSNKELTPWLSNSEKDKYWRISIYHERKQTIISCVKFILFLENNDLPKKFRIEFLDNNTENHRIENLKVIKLDCTDDEFANKQLGKKRQTGDYCVRYTHYDEQPRLSLQDLDKEIKGLFFRRRIIDNNSE